MIRKEKSEIMKKFFIVLITIIGFFSIENIVYANPTATIVMLNARKTRIRKINEKFEELYGNKEDFAELYNILSTDEKKLLNENYSLENYEKARVFFKEQILLEKENIKNENIRKAKAIEEFKKAGFFRKLELLVFEDVGGELGSKFVAFFFVSIGLSLIMIVTIIAYIYNKFLGD